MLQGQNTIERQTAESRIGDASMSVGQEVAMLLSANWRDFKSYWAGQHIAHLVHTVEEELPLEVLH